MKASSRIINMMAELSGIQERLPSAALHMMCGRKNILGGYLPQTVRDDMSTAILAMGRMYDALRRYENGEGDAQ
ncbi:MAG: hypothetical protein IJJ51_00975 [Kiritimatiellae bacterium]|nr:hypothetical protein [Kiritimatiellia bacterium]